MLVHSASYHERDFAMCFCVLDWRKRTIDPWDDDTLGEGDDHEGEDRTVPVHDLQDVDAAL